jgi:hypothetical protein
MSISFLSPRISHCSTSIVTGEKQTNMDHFYLVVFPNGKRGVGTHCAAAVEAALGKDYKTHHDFAMGQPRGFDWTAYLPRTLNDKQGERTAPVSRLPLRYETCSVSHKGEQLYEVFRSPSPEAIKRLVAKYGYARQSAGITFAVNAKPKQIPSRNPEPRSSGLSKRIVSEPSKSSGNRPLGKVRTPPRRVD